MAFTVPIYPTSTLIAYGTKGKAAGITVPNNKQAAVFNVRAYNNSGSAINVGICRLLNLFSGTSGNFRLWQYVASGPTYTDVGSTISSGVTIFDTTNNDGYLVQSKSRFGMVGFNITQATSGSPVFTYKYWNGSSFSTLTTLDITTYGSTGNAWVVFQPPADWVIGATASTVDQDKYTIWVQATTAPGQNVTVNSMWVAELIELYESVANNAAVQLSFPDSKPLLLEGGQSLIPYFATANAANQFGAFYTLL